VAIKQFAHQDLLWREISHPVLGSFIPAFDMCLMVLADIIANFSLLSGQIIWYFAIVLHIIFAASFIYHRIRDFDLNHMLPSWYIPPVGKIVACVTGSNMHAPIITQVIFYLGFALYCGMLPVMMYRLIFGDRINDTQLPSFAIMGAPASLCLAGYLTAFSQPNPMIVGFLLALALMMTSLVYISMIRINAFRITFIPIYASFTFPMAIGSTALIKYSNYIGIKSDAGQFWHALGVIEMAASVVVISLVLVKMTSIVTKKVILA
jgi:tellurite resistance protein TehA-like permease